VSPFCLFLCPFSPPRSWEKHLVYNFLAVAAVAPAGVAAPVHAPPAALRAQPHQRELHRASGGHPLDLPAGSRVEPCPFLFPHPRSRGLAGVQTYTPLPLWDSWRGVPGRAPAFEAQFTFSFNTGKDLTQHLRGFLPFLLAARRGACGYRQ